MTTPAIGHARCGCDCKNQTEFAVCDGRELNVCCEHAPDGAPSAYGLLWECVNLDLFHGKIGVVWRDCQQECKWSTRDGFFSLGPDPLPCDPTGVPTANWRYFPPMYIDNTQPDGQQWQYAPLPFKCCASVPNSTLYGSGDRDGFRDWYGVAACDVFPTKSAEVSASNVIWELERTSPTTATLTYFGGVVVGAAFAEPVIYNCDNFASLGRSSFTRDDATFQWVIDHYLNVSSPFVHLKKNVCADAIVGNYRTPCDTAQDACACADSGWSSACLTTGGSCGLPDRLTLTRNAALPGCITAPTPAPCGYFYGEGSASGGTLGFLLWCDGGRPWKLRVYCFATSPCVLVCDVDTVEVRTCPDGYEFTWSCASFGDCCSDGGGTVDTECCPDVPQTLTGTFNEIARCPGIDGVTITLNNIPGYELWEGSVDVCNQTINLRIGCDSTSGEFRYYWWDSNVVSGSGCIGTSTAPSVGAIGPGTAGSAALSFTCDPFYMKMKAPLNPSPTCSCCGPFTPDVEIEITA